MAGLNRSADLSAIAFPAACSDWSHSFTRLLTSLRAVLWQKRQLLDYIRSYGTAGGSFRALAAPQQAYFPGFATQYGTAHG